MILHEGDHLTGAGVMSMREMLVSFSFSGILYWYIWRGFTHGRIKKSVSGLCWLVKRWICLCRGLESFLSRQRTTSPDTINEQWHRSQCRKNDGLNWMESGTKLKIKSHLEILNMILRIVSLSPFDNKLNINVNLIGNLSVWNLSFS